MVGCAVKSCFKRSEKSNYGNDGISYHKFPTNPILRKKWRDFCRRVEGWLPRRTSSICSDHFEPSCFEIYKSRRKIRGHAVPTIYACRCKAPSGSDGPGSSASEDPVSVKFEVEEDEISEHEEDIMVQLENRKRMLEKDPIAVDTKKVKVEPDGGTQSVQQSQYELVVQPQTSSSSAQSQFVLVQPQMPQVQSQVQPQYVVVQPQESQTHPQFLVVSQPPTQNKCPKIATQSQQAESDPDLIPEFFMSVVVQNQKEILKILKQQVLLQDPDPEILTFLRFLGAKLLRLPKEKRNEMQDKITRMILLE